MGIKASRIVSTGAPRTLDCGLSPLPVRDHPPLLRRQRPNGPPAGHLPPSQRRLRLGRLLLPGGALCPRPAGLLPGIDCPSAPQLLLRQKRGRPNPIGWNTSSPPWRRSSRPSGRRPRSVPRMERPPSLRPCAAWIIERGLCWAYLPERRSSQPRRWRKS